MMKQILNKIDEYNKAARKIFDNADYKYYKLVDPISVTDNDINYLEKIIGVTIPNDLRLFYKNIGRIVNSGNDEAYCLIIREPKELIKKDIEYFYENRDLSFGIIDRLNAEWGFQKDDFQPDAYDGALTSEEIQCLNKEYKYFGLTRSSFEGANFLFFDRNGNFGQIYYDQDTRLDTVDELKHLFKEGLSASDALEDILIDWLEHAKNTMIEDNE